MNTNHNATRPGPGQINETLNTHSSWPASNSTAVADLPTTGIEAPDRKVAVDLAREQCPAKATDLAIVDTKAQAREQAKLERQATRDLKYIAAHQAARAVTSHRFGYRVESITTRPHACAFDAGDQSSEYQLGHTQLSGVPTEAELNDPRNRLEAENYMISVMAGPMAEFLAGRRTRSGSGPDRLVEIDALLDLHGYDSFGPYESWLKERTLMMLTGPAARDLKMITDLLIRRREITGDEFREALVRHTDTDQPQGESIIPAQVVPI